MLRSLYSAVSGMQAHQTKLDVIGNNIANVNTYGFKSSKARFQDVFYQTLQNSTAGNNLVGGTNASQVGYGTKVAGIDLNMGRSSLQSTGSSKDVAITGEGFFQVMDADGNIFYTRAGKLQVDAASGSLTDSNGYTVLGVSGNPLGQAANSQKIRLNVNNKQATQSTVTNLINKVNHTITAENSTVYGDVAISFELDESLPDGADIYVKPSELSETNIVVYVNDDSTFTSWTDFNKKMNEAITRANGGITHPAGNFTVSSATDRVLFDPANPLTGAEIVGDDFKIQQGEMNFRDAGHIQNGIFGGFKPSGMSTEPMFTAEGNVSYKITHNNTANPAYYEITADVAQADGTTRTFVGQINANSTGANKVWLKETAASSTAAGETAGQYIEMSHLGYTAITSYFNDNAADPATFPTTINNGGTITAAHESRQLGFGTVFALKGGSEGGALDLSSLSIAVLSNGVITAQHPDEGAIEIGRLDLAMFENPNGLEEVGNGYFQVGNNSGEPQLVKAGQDGSGALQTSALEMSNVDISDEFADMIVTQRGFQANSRIITVSDSILEELVNLVR